MIRVAIKNGDWNLIAEMGAGYSNETENGITTIIPLLKIYREISSVKCSYYGSNEYRYDILTSDGREEILYISLNKDTEGYNAISVSRSSTSETPVPIAPVTDEIYDYEIEELFSKLHLYQKLAEYSSASMEVDYNVTDPSGMYNKVIDEKYDTWEEWTAFVSSVFCGDYLANIIKNSDLYINVDGYTYCMQGGMGWYLSEEYTYEIIENNVTEVVINISYEDNSPGAENGASQTFTYVLTKTENGWRISNQLPS